MRAKLTDSQMAKIFLAMASLLHAGMDLSACGNMIPGDTPLEKSAVAHVTDELAKGEPMAGAIASSDVFPAYASGLVDIGERSGRTEETLRALSDYYWKSDRRTAQIKSALAYPIILLGIMLGVILVLMAKVLPIFESVYASLGGHMDGMAAGLLVMGNAVNGALPAICAVLGCIIAAALACACIDPIRTRISEAMQWRGGDKGLSRKLNDARFAQAMAMALQSGLTMEESIGLAGNLQTDQSVARKRCAACLQLIGHGEGLAEALSKSRLLPEDACALLALGQKSGTADEVMETLALRMSDEADEAMQKAIGRIEPALVLTASLLTGAILIAVMLPLMDIMATIG